MNYIYTQLAYFNKTPGGFKGGILPPYLNSITKRKRPSTCHILRAGRAKLTSSTTASFHRYFPIKLTSNIARIKAIREAKKLAKTSRLTAGLVGASGFFERPSTVALAIA